MSDTEQTGADTFSGKRILVVEDEFLIALDIQRILEGAGVRTIVMASRLEQALEIVASGAPFDAAVLDLKLDREISTPVAERLHATRTPFVFLTGGASESGITQRFAQAPVVGKPFDGDVLLAALIQAMAAKS